MTAYYIIHTESHFPEAWVNLVITTINLMTCAAHNKYTESDRLKWQLCEPWTAVCSLCNLFVWRLPERTSGAFGGIRQLCAAAPLIRAAIDFLRFELITCFTRETGLQWHPLRSPLILRKLPHGLADGFTGMCSPIENNYTGDCGAGANLEHSLHSEHFKTAIGEACDLT